MIEKIIGFVLLFLFLLSFLSVLGNLLAALLNPIELKLIAFKRLSISLAILIVTFLVAYKLGYFIDKYK
ncbi:hypothetical protein TW82_07535 [Pseudoalteromonas fuliginea]|uniref:Uncharacterized protein n=1 Tax=Pseudoalteromonas fuliginea TaxID=1872678 RepID=A0ABD3Y8T7_9GAMM|nr:hypothetical protein AOR04_19855 [Pseudoalteromonas sp. 1_2015MBL_MicDiv]KDC50964.1 hypothetical protein DC53_10505 [Pseudoalteromonas fuliginea]KJZ28351.1 hypothetical protein TW82_07535 [Pseudoalteromonas fuliginea]